MALGVSLASGHQAWGATTVSGVDIPGAELEIAPSGAATPVEDLLVTGGPAPVFFLQPTKGTRLVNRITFGPIAAGMGCPDPAVVVLQVIESPDGPQDEGGVIAEGYVDDLSTTLSNRTFNLTPFTLKEGRSYRFTLKRGSGACSYYKRGTWPHAAEELEGGDRECAAIQESGSAYQYRLWHDQGQNDVVDCPSWGDPPSGFEPEMPTGWLNISRYSSFSWVEAPTGGSSCSGDPGQGVTTETYTDAQNQTKKACLWSQFAPFGTETDDGWYRASFSGGEARDMYFKAWVDESSLAAHYKPYMRFDSTEWWRPLNLDYMISDPVTYEEEPAVFKCDGEDCVAMESMDDLSLTDPSGDYLDLNGEGVEEDDSSYYTPAEVSCGTRLALDCNAGNRSVMYWRHTLAPDNDNDYEFIQYWAFYRFNDFDAPGFLAGDHEGDWEAMAVAPTQLNHEAGAFDLVSFSQHGHWFSYLRENMLCWTPYLPDCGTDEVRGPWQPMVFVAQGSHANYAKPCTNDPPATVCGRNGAGEEELAPEHNHDGGRGWGNNGANSDGLAPLGEEPWAAWPGEWGAGGDVGSPASPANQGMWDVGWDACADPDDDCLSPIGEISKKRRRGALARLIAGPRLHSCDDWFGGDVALAVCDHRRLRRTANRARFAKADPLMTARVSRPKVRGKRRVFRAGTAPGLAQLVNSPLHSGDVIRLRARRATTLTLQLRAVTARGRVVAFRWKRVRVDGKSRLRIHVSARRATLTATSTGRVLTSRERQP